MHADSGRYEQMSNRSHPSVITIHQQDDYTPAVKSSQKHGYSNYKMRSEDYCFESFLLLILKETALDRLYKVKVKVKLRLSAPSAGIAEIGQR